MRWKAKGRRILLEVIGDLLLARVSGRVAGHRLPRQSAVRAGAEEHQGVVAATPGIPDTNGAIEQPERQPRALEEEPRCERGLTRTHDDHVENAVGLTIEIH